MPAFASASPQVRVLVEGRWGTGDDLEEVSTDREVDLFAVLVKKVISVKNECVCPQKGNMNVTASVKVVIPK